MARLRALDRMSPRSFRSVVSLVAVLAPVTAIVAFAVRADGYHRTRADLHAEGVWVTRETDRSIGYVSKASGRLEVRFAVAQLGRVDLSQSGADLLVHDPTTKRAQVHDARTSLMQSTVGPLPDGAQLGLGSGVASILDPTSGQFQAGAPSQLGALLTGEPDAPADISASGGGVEASSDNPAALAVGLDGRVHVASSLTNTVTTKSPDEPSTTTLSWSEPLGGPLQITTAGRYAVVLDQPTSLLVLPGGRLVDLSTYGSAPRIQAPSDDESVVLVATDDQLVAVGLRNGKVQTLATGGTGAAVPPVRVRGRSFVAWSARLLALRVDADGEHKIYDDSGRPSPNAAWRVGKGLVALNDAATGSIIFENERDQELTKLGDSDWLKAAVRDNEDPNAAGEGPEDGQEVVARDEPTSEQQAPPEPRPDDEYGTREGRPVVVPVLANDSDPNGDVLLVADVSDVQGGEAGIVAGGTAVQFRPTAPDGGSFAYSASDGADRANARAAIRIYPADGADNQPPRRPRDAGTGEQLSDPLFTVAVGARIEINLLRNWFDPEGDTFGLSAAPAFDPPEAAAWFTTEPDGRLSGKAFAPGSITVSAPVLDDFNGTATAKVVIDVVDQAVPKTLPDTVFARPGETVIANVLANDLGSNLQVGTVTSPSQRVFAQGIDGGERVSMRAEEPGEYKVAYEVVARGSGGPPVRGMIRFVVPARGPDIPNRPPVAAVDVAAAKPGVPITVDVLANDGDTDADVLVVTDARAAGSGVEVRVVERRYVRVLVDDFPDTNTVLVRYRISDGVGADEGQLRVRRDPFTGDRPPILREDRKAVRAGQILRVPVLANDSDPDSPLHLKTDPVVATGGEGDWRSNGDEIVFLAPANEGQATANYQVEGSAEHGQIRIAINRLEQGSNVTLDRLPDTTARAVAGEELRIALPLDVDPDGDPLLLTGTVVPAADPLGVTTLSDEDRENGIVRYQAESTRQGVDFFDYEVQEQFGDKRSLKGRVWVGVARAESVRDQPIANPDVVLLKPGETRRVDVLRNDTPAGRIELVDVDPVGAAFGEVSIDGSGSSAALIYTAPADATRAEYSLRYRAGLDGLTAIGTVSVRVAPDQPNIPPVVTNGTVRLSPGKPGRFEVLTRADDPDGDRSKLQLALEPGATDGRVDGTAIAVDALDATRTVTFVVTDEGGAATTGFVRFEVDNLPPTSSWAAPEVDADEPQTVQLRDFITDPDGDSWEFRLATNPVNGTIRASDVPSKSVVFSANPDAENAQFDAVVEDGRGRSASLVFAFKVRTNRAPNPLPVALGLPAKGAARLLTIDPNDADVQDKGSHTLSNCSPSNGVRVEIQGSLGLSISTELPKGATGTVTCTVRDSRNKTGTAVVNVEVEGTDRARPAAQPMSFELSQAEQGGTDQEKPVPFEDPLGEGVQITIVNEPVGVRAIVVGTSLRVSPPSTGFSGRATFGYRVTDGEGREAESTVTVLVRGTPLPPARPNVAAGHQQVVVEWAPPAPNGVPVDSYEVVPSAGQAVTVRGTTTATIAGLSNGSPYTFSVRACHDEWGCGASSASSAPAVPDSPPGAPLNFSAEAGDGQVLLAWAAGESGGSSGVSYRVDCSACGGSQTVNSTQFTWRGLTNKTAYTFTITAVKTLASTGKVAESNQISVSAKPFGKPLAPAVANPGRRDDGTVTVNWQDADDNGDPITGYRVRLDGAPNASCPVAGVAAVCSNVPKGATVYAVVAAENRAGVGPEGRSAEPVVSASRPSRPTITAVQGRGSNADLSVNVSDTGGVSLSSFVLYRNGTEIGTAPAAGVISVPTPEPGSYTFSVIAVNEAGYSGDRSAESRSVKGQGVPAVTFNAASIDRTLRWTWSIDPRSADNVSVTLGGAAVGLSGSTDVPVGCGETHSRRLVVTYEWDSVQQPRIEDEKPSTAAPCPQPVVALSKGASAEGQTTDLGTACKSACYYLHISAQNFPAGGRVLIRRYTKLPSEASFSEWVMRNDEYMTVRSDGTIDQDSIHFYGYIGGQVYVTLTINGQTYQSNPQTF